jgi:hypothetical protein
VEKFKPHVIAPEGSNYTESMRSRTVRAYKTVRRRITNLLGEKSPGRKKISKLLGPFPPEDEPFAELEYREALAGGMAYFPIEVHKNTRRFGKDFLEFLEAQAEVSISLQPCSSWHASKERFEETASGFLLASAKFALSNISRESDIITSIGSYRDDLRAAYPELPSTGEIRVFAHFGTYHVGIYYFGKRLYSQDSGIKLTKRIASTECSGNRCSMFLRFGKLPPAEILYADMVALSQISAQSYGFLARNEGALLKAAKPLIRSLKSELLP